MNYQDFFGVRGFHSLVFGLTNQCNLHCEKCSGMFNFPIDPESPYPNRRTSWQLPVSDVETFCEKFKGIGEENNHRLTGGEPTAIAPELFEEIVEVLHSYGRRVTIITNGFGLMDIDHATLNQISTIFLNDHGINHEHVENCVKYLKPFYKGAIGRDSNTYHFDLWKAKDDQSNKGKKCGMWMTLPTLLRGVFYPCCNMPLIGEFDQNPDIHNSFMSAGWALNDVDIVHNLRNWRKTIPRYAVDQCMDNCWQPNPSVGGRFDITSKPNDVIKRGTLE